MSKAFSSCIEFIVIEPAVGIYVVMNNKVLFKLFFVRKRKRVVLCPSPDARKFTCKIHKLESRVLRVREKSGNFALLLLCTP